MVVINVVVDDYDSQQAIEKIHPDTLSPRITVTSDHEGCRRCEEVDEADAFKLLKSLDHVVGRHEAAKPARWSPHAMSLFTTLLSKFKTFWYRVSTCVSSGMPMEPHGTEY